MAIKKRCLRCLQVLREDGTCQNEECVKFVPLPEPALEPEPQEQK